MPKNQGGAAVADKTSAKKSGGRMTMQRGQEVNTPGQTGVAANAAVATQDETTQVADNEPGHELEEEVELIRPTGNEEFLEWYLPLVSADREGGPMSLDELVEAYPGDIKKESLSAKISKIRGIAREHMGIEVPEARRSRGKRSSNNPLEIGARLAAKFNLTRLVADTPETAKA